MRSLLPTMAPCRVMGESLDFCRWASRSVALTTVMADGIIIGNRSGSSENIDDMAARWASGIIDEMRSTSRLKKVWR